jgi:hypothetical protein
LLFYDTSFPDDRRTLFPFLSFKSLLINREYFYFNLSAMHLSTIDLFELGQYLRIVLWICLPLIIVSLLVTTWIHYRRRMLDPGGWRLAMEGLDSSMEPIEPMEPERISAPDPDTPVDSLSYLERTPDPDTHVERDPRDNDQWGKESVSEWKGKDNIYQGILWMKDKYEQYRDQSDQRYALLKEELSRLEGRYQDLLLSIENKTGLPATEPQAAPAGAATMPEMAPMSETIIIDETVIADNPAADTAALHQQLETRQLIIDELEEQLRIERLKVEELVAKLQNNSQLLMNIYQELDKSFNLPKEAL